MALTTLVLAFIIVFGISYFSTRIKIPKGLRAVPGPKGLPIVGSLLDIPEYPEKQYMKWAREYGELFQVQLGWNNWVFVNSEEAVKVPSSYASINDEGNP
jgi:Cytochrome P450